jgi:hypothetical protein
MKYARPIWLLVVAAAFAAGSGWALENIRQIPARSLPVPETVSAAMQPVIGAPLAPIWNNPSQVGPGVEGVRTATSRHEDENTSWSARKNGRQS